MIIDITAHKAFQRHTDIDDAADAVGAEIEAIIDNLSRTLAMAEQTLQTLRAMPTPGVVKLVAEQRVLIDQLLCNLEPLEPQLMRAGVAFLRQYRPLTNNLRRISFEMDEAIRNLHARPTMVLTLQSTPPAWNIAEIAVLVIIGSALLGVIRTIIG